VVAMAAENRGISFDEVRFTFFAPAAQGTPSTKGPPPTAVDGSADACGRNSHTAGMHHDAQPWRACEAGFGWLTGGGQRRAEGMEYTARLVSAHYVCQFTGRWRRRFDGLPRAHDAGPLISGCSQPARTSRDCMTEGVWGSWSEGKLV
jgi:hypothetical protein